MNKSREQKREWDKISVSSLRRHLGWTQQKMAEEMGIRQQTVSEWEQGMYQPRGTSATLLSIIAERVEFQYESSPKEKKE